MTLRSHVISTATSAGDAPASNIFRRFFYETPITTVQNDSPFATTLHPRPNNAKQCSIPEEYGCEIRVPLATIVFAKLWSRESVWWTIKFIRKH